MLELDRRVQRFVERHWIGVQVAALAVVAGLGLGGVAASVVFGTGAAVRAAVLAVLGAGAAVGTTLLATTLVVPGDARRRAR